MGRGQEGQEGRGGGKDPLGGGSGGTKGQQGWDQLGEGGRCQLSPILGSQGECYSGEGAALPRAQRTGGPVRTEEQVASPE